MRVGLPMFPGPLGWQGRGWWNLSTFPQMRHRMTAPDRHRRCLGGACSSVAFRTVSSRLQSGHQLFPRSRNVSILLLFLPFFWLIQISYPLLVTRFWGTLLSFGPPQCRPPSCRCPPRRRRARRYPASSFPHPADFRRPWRTRSATRRRPLRTLRLIPKSLSGKELSGISPLWFTPCIQQQGEPQDVD